MTSSKTETIVRRNSRKVKLSAKVKSPAPVKPAPSSKKSAAAGLPILPGEDAGAYRRRLKAWTGSLEPRNAVETYLVEHAVVLSWELDRAQRAQLAMFADAAGRVTAAQTSTQASDDGTQWPFDASDSTDRLRSYRLACGQALFSTLDAFSGLRGIGKTADGTRDFFPITPATPLAAELSGAIDAPVSGPVGTSAQSRDPHPCHVSTALLEILATGGMQGELSSSAPSIGRASAPPLRPADAVAAAPDPVGGPDASQASADDPHGETAAGPRRRPAIRRIRQVPWSGSGGPATSGAAPIGLKSNPVHRVRQPSESNPNPPDTRRRVGGYAVPMDPSIPVAGADRIPVRLRRDASGTRHERSVAFPSS